MSNSNSVQNQTWATIRTSMNKVQQEVVEQRENQQRIGNLAHIGKKQQMEKDVLMPAALMGEGATSLKSRSLDAQEEANRPFLPGPDGSYEGAEGGSIFGKDVGLIAIIGAVLALQAKTNSNFWSTLWKQTSESMMIQVKFAPLIAEATIDAANYQADATRQQAKSEEISGTINLVMFGASVALGAFMEIKNPENDITKTDQVVKDDTEVPAEDAPASPDSPEQIQKEETNTTNKVAKAVEKGDAELKSQAKSLGKKLLAGSKKQMSFAGFLTKLGNASQMLNLAAQGSTSLVNQHYLSLQANDQQAQGQAEALSKQAEQYSQFYGQDFSRGTDLAQGTSQNIDYAVNILKSASDTITQTVNSMFSKI